MAYADPWEEFAERSVKPIALRDILSQAQKYKAQRGVEAPTAAVATAVEPALRAGAETRLRAEQTENIRRLKERQQEFKEESFETGVELTEKLAEEQWTAEEEMFAEDVRISEKKLELQERWVAVEEQKATMQFWGSVVGLVIGTVGLQTWTLFGGEAAATEATATEATATEAIATEASAFV